MEEMTVILLNLFLIFTAAKLSGALFIRLGMPSIIGEVLVGILIGPYALGLIGVPDSSLLHLFGGDSQAAGSALDLVLEVMAELGVILLLFFVGLETHVRELFSVRGRAALVGFLGILFPFLLGFGLMILLGRNEIESAFVATAMVSTSIGITAAVFGELGVLRDREARIILGAAVVDDVLGLMLLAVVSSLGGGQVNFWELALTALEVVVFLVFIVLVGTRMVRRYHLHLERLPIRNAPLVVTIFLMLGFSVLAGFIGLAAIIGAFLAGLMLSEARQHYKFENLARPVYDFLVPFFFVVTGSKVDISAFLDPALIGLFLAVALVAVLGKLIGAGLGSWGLPLRSAAIIGVGMVPRGEVGLVVASIGIGLGIISNDMYSAVVFMSLATTVIAPLGLARLVSGRSPEKMAEDQPGKQLQPEEELAEDLV
jgi:Kef-type K+ transport system membrane component KefB